MNEAVKSKRTFSSLVRMPYQDAIAVILRCHDYHMNMVLNGENQEFHQLQAERLKSWLVDVKDYITKLEKEEKWATEK